MTKEKNTTSDRFQEPIDAAIKILAEQLRTDEYQPIVKGLTTAFIDKQGNMNKHFSLEWDSDDLLEAVEIGLSKTWNKMFHEAMPDASGSVYSYICRRLQHDFLDDKDIKAVDSPRDDWSELQLKAEQITNERRMNIKIQRSYKS